VLEEWYETQDPSQVYLFATDMYDNYDDFGNGYVPFFAVIGPQNVLYYGDNDVGGIYDPLVEAISDFALMANFSTTSQTGPPALGIQFTSNATSPNGDVLTWEWDFDGDGVFDSTEENPFYTYTVPGTYTVSLRVTDVEGEAELTMEDYIVVQEPDNVSGEITGTWSPTYGPYILTGNILVNDQSTLTIEPGTEVIVGEGLNIEVNGQLTVSGEQDNLVKISSETTWGGIKFIDAEMDNLIDGCEISNVFGSAIFAENTGCLHVENSWIINNDFDANQGTAFELKYTNGD